MIEVAIMNEGQNVLPCERRQRIPTLVEAIGFASLCKSGHYANANPPDKDSLEQWVSHNYKVRQWKY